MSVATIQSRIDDQGQIAGVSREEMIEQVINLNSGALPADLEYVEERTVGASLGAASIRAGVLASLGGLGLVLLFMLAYYRLAGVNALVSVVLNLLILLALMAYIPVTLTLPGIAGLILTIGMGVDSNVLIFERIKEELATAGGPRSAVRAAFTRVWLTIVDTHVTSLIAAAFLFQFGTSSDSRLCHHAGDRPAGERLHRGVRVAHVVRGAALPRPASHAGHRRRRSLRQRAANFTRWRWHALVLSLVIIGAGMATSSRRGVPLGIDFSGGTLVVVEFPQTGVTEERCERRFRDLPGDAVVQRYGAAAERQFLIRLPLGRSSGERRPGGGRSTGRRRRLTAADLPEFQIVEKRELVSAMIGSDLQRRGIYAAVASLAAITVYIGIRFRASFAVGAIAATLHDVLVTLACVSLAGYDLSLNVMAALLTIIGYSVNDTIVIFDRVRENAKGMPAEGARRGRQSEREPDPVAHGDHRRDDFLSVVALYVFGGEALRGFAFTMLVGIVGGTYSTVFIASAIATLLSGRTEPVHAPRRAPQPLV